MVRARRRGLASAGALRPAGARGAPGCPAPERRNLAGWLALDRRGLAFEPGGCGRPGRGRDCRPEARRQRVLAGEAANHEAVVVLDLGRYALPAEVLGPLATYAEPHAYDLCDQHAERLSAPRGWEVLRLVTDLAPAGPSDDDLLALANAVREAGGRALIVGGWVRDRLLGTVSTATNVDIEVFGIPADRLRTVSYGKEFPFDPGRTEEAFAKNRRAHFVVTSK